MKTLGYDFQTAREKMLERCSGLGSETISLEKAYGRILAKDVTVKYDVPLFDKSPLDGYAFIDSDTLNATKEQPVNLTVVEEIPAGAYSGRELKPGTAVKILTGAPIPAGATAVAKYEETEFGTDYVKLFHPYQKMDNIILKGEDINAGDLVACEGTLIDSAVHGKLASQGNCAIEVYKLPLIGIISQGNEVIGSEEELRPGKIYNTNRFMLSGALKKEDFSSIYLGTSRDDEVEIANMISDAVCMYDAVIMTGGVSVGTYDFTEAAMKRAGAEILVDKIFMKPGSSCCLGILNGVPVFGLSGNPSAAMTTFYLVVLPVIRKISGLKNYLPKKIRVRLNEDFKKASKNTRILKGSLDLSQGTAIMKLNQKQGNGMVSAMQDAEVFAVIPSGSGPVDKGSWLEAYLI
ncbi:Molybdopterin molybdenumtransferase [uncultured Roseburia sp.]|uniref:Molybdopterin molybdenumtransferase n=1 Tax=Brotonthovivens ammoniilytica TaxID=2981725 RepID=A0ABT2TEW7_9FIRM|nr:gephyrin-like molybdotransferase Glp [Brotonthovivens ammoniilytica]MCU6760728.1 molybdopterin molybdotransferase MoeA [Brotonthovivens ammoniilytica]SCI07327.1 Molybdopterin molybdenumtransferase [uncultured Roseburia sp.]